jgi:hypothetical protein
MKFNSWEIAILVVVSVILVTVAIVVPLLATGVLDPQSDPQSDSGLPDYILALPETFELVSITDEYGVEKTPNYPGRYTRLRDTTSPFYSDSITWLRDELSNGKQYAMVLHRRIADELKRHNEDETDPKWQYTLEFQIPKGTLAARSTKGTASTRFTAVNPITFDGTWHHEDVNSDARIVTVKM